jgi:hypothetical protein
MLSSIFCAALIPSPLQNVDIPSVLFIGLLPDGVGSTDVWELL